MQNLTWFLVLSLNLFMSSPMPGQEEPLSDEQLASIQLPMDPEDPVFEFDSFGGYRMATPADFEPTPSLQVFADGKIVTGGHNPTVKSYSRHLSEAELNQFLHFVVNRNGFYEIHTAELKDRMAGTGKELFIADSPTSRFTINLQRGANSVEIYALSFAARTFEEVEEVRKLLEIQRRCQQLIATCHLGDQQQTENLLGKINQQLKEEYPDVPEIQSADVRFATRFTDGKFQSSFRKSFEQGEETQIRVIDVRVFQPAPQAPMKIEISESKINPTNGS